jgi:serine/threonine protein kinase
MPLTAGSRLGPYEILTSIGSGGTGEVFKARDTRLGRTVAIKVYAPGLGERFEAEARAIAALNHPNICTIYDIGPNYLVMEFVDGTPLRGPMPLDQALRLAIQLADALTAAHERGIVHRDLKPGNILVTRNKVKLLDFGLAKTTRQIGADDSTVTASESGLVVGTFAYMSPEQAQALPVDSRSDVFSFGLVLYEILTGRHPFAASTAVATMAAILRDEPPSLQIAPALDRVVQRCLRKIPARSGCNGSIDAGGTVGGRFAVREYER